MNISQVLDSKDMIKHITLFIQDNKSLVNFGLTNKKFTKTCTCEINERYLSQSIYVEFVGTQNRDGLCHLYKVNQISGDKNHWPRINEEPRAFNLTTSSCILTGLRFVTTMGKLLENPNYQKL